MDLHHVFCLAPHLAKGGTSNNFINSKVEKIFQILSVAAWKRNHPTAKVRMYADSAGAKWLKINGLDALYDEINTQILDAMPKKIHHAVFWAAGKIYAYQDAIRKVEQPIFMDIDAILWENVENLGLTGDIVAAHWENFSVFDGFKANDLQTPHDYQFPNWASILQNAPFRHLNASFLWFRNVELTNAYLFESKRFIESNPASNAAILPNWVYMCFAEQALLADTALFFNKKIETLGDLDAAALNARFSHLWGAKKMILQDKSYENALFDRCLEILKQHYLFFCKHIENFH
jgi:hypothetical protein